MNIYQGNQQDFSLLSYEGTFIRVGYGLQAVKNHSGLYQWHEVTLPKNQHPQITIDVIKEAVIADIDARTEAKILNGYVFTPDDAEEPIKVWLSKENQTNFSEAQRLQIVPVKFKLNEDENRRPVYHTFKTVEELNRFYIGGVQYIQQCLNEGWAEKDKINWEPYEALFQQAENSQSENAEQEE